MFKNNLLLLFFLSGYWATCLAQPTISVADYFKNKIEKNLVEVENIQRTFNPSWIHQVDFRTETDEFDAIRQRYSVRVSPSSPKVRKAQINLHQLYQDKANLEKSETKDDFIEMAYEELLNLLELSEKLILKNAWLVILQDQEKVITKLIQVSEQSTKDWITVQQNIAQLQIDIYQHETELNELLPIGRKLDWTTLIPLEILIAEIQNLAKEETILLKQQEIDIEKKLIEGEMNLEKAEKKNILDFIQIDYRGPQKNPFDERLSITAGFQFPFSGQQKLKLEELAIEKEALEKNAMVRKRLHDYKVKTKLRKLNILVKELIFTQKIIQEQAQKTNLLLEKQSQNADSNPLFLLYQKEEQIKKQLEILKLEMSLYQEYVEYLSLTERLFQKPYYNHLGR